MDRGSPQGDVLHDPLPPDETGAESVLRALRDAGVDARDVRLAGNVDALADRLLDRADLFPGPRLSSALTHLTGATMRERARALCERSFLLLDVAALADEAILRCSTGALCGERERPFRAWSERLLREAARWAIDAPEFQLYRSGPTAPQRERILGELSRLTNHLDVAARQVVWLQLVERRDLQSIVAETGMPRERAEWILRTVLEEAARIVSKDGSRDGADGRQEVEHE